MTVTIVFFLPVSFLFLADLIAFPLFLWRPSLVNRIWIFYLSWQHITHRKHALSNPSGAGAVKTTLNPWIISTAFSYSVTQTIYSTQLIEQEIRIRRIRYTFNSRYIQRNQVLAILVYLTFSFIGICISSQFCWCEYMAPVENRDFLVFSLSRHHM